MYPEQGAPPLNGPFLVLERVLVHEPPVLEHDDHDLHWFQVQSTENDLFNIWKRVLNLKRGAKKATTIHSMTHPPASLGQLFVLQSSVEVDDPVHCCPP